MPKPNAHHACLDPFVGAWVGVEKMLPSQWMPAETIAQAKVVNRRGASGFVLYQDYQQSREGTVTFTGHGVFWFDRESGKQRLHWWDAMGMKPSEFRGGFEGQRLVLRSQSPMGHTRASWVFHGDTYEHVLEMSQDGQTWKTLMEGTYQRLD